MVGQIPLFGFLLTIATLSLTSFAIPLSIKTNLNKLEMIPSNVWRSPGTLGVFDYPPLFGTCDEPCDKNGKEPICGTNDKDYSSLKELKCHQLCEKKEIGIKHYGKCKKSKSTPSKLKSNESKRQV